MFPQRRILSRSCGLLSAALLTTVVLAGCSDTNSSSSAAWSITPVTAPTTTTAPAAPSTTAATPSTLAGAAEQATMTIDGASGSMGPPTTVAATAEDRALVTETLLRYDLLLMGMLGNAAALASPDHPAVAAWRAVLTPDSRLLLAVYGTIAAEQRTRASIVRADDSGHSHHHRATRVWREDADTIAFSYCNWAPAMAVSPTDGSVIEDRPLHEEGIGTLRQVNGTWLLHELDSQLSERHPRGTADRCEPARETIARSTGGDR